MRPWPSSSPASASQQDSRGLLSAWNPCRSLKAVVQTELHHPRPDSIGRVELLCDLAKIHRVYVLAPYEKARMIEKVVKIGPQIDLLAFRDFDRLPYRHIVIV